jgi:tryptophanyl-tRNA synthetase
MNRKRVLAGMRASGRLHLGNYFGGAKGMVALQDDTDHETFYMVADLHGITTPYNKETLAQDTRNVVLDYLAAGLDPEKSTIFIDSHVPEVTELAFLSSSLITIARMQHLPTFKEKIKNQSEAATMALLNYPVLMAADILAFKADKVPVGIDQEPHLEVAREVARKMNDNYGTSFPEPQRFTVEGGEYIPSLLGEGKMSKSVEGSYILLTDDLETIKKRLAKVPTDSGKGFVIVSMGDANYEELLPNIKNMDENTVNKIKKGINYQDKETGSISLGVRALMELVSLFDKEGGKRKKYEEQYQNDGIRYKDLKEELAEVIYQELKPIQEKRKEYENQPEKVEKILKEGAEKARAIAKVTVKEVKDKMGFLPGL